MASSLLFFDSLSISSLFFLFIPLLCYPSVVSPFLTPFCSFLFSSSVLFSSQRSGSQQAWQLIENSPYTYVCKRSSSIDPSYGTLSNYT
jgi:hypothetical protein